MNFGAEMKQFRVAKSVVINRSDDGFVAMNLMNKSAFAIDPPLFEVLAGIGDAAGVADLGERFPDYDVVELEEALAALEELGAVVALGSAQHEADRTLNARWLFGAPALGLHLMTRDMEFASAAESEDGQKARMAEEPPPRARLGLKDRAVIIDLPDPMADNELIALMAKRRTNRLPQATPIALEALADALFAGLGIVGETSNVTGALPLKMTPSGGARNPFEAYVVVRNVVGLAPGAYHYCGLAHALEPVNGDEPPALSALIADQDWADGMAAMIVLVAHFERTMWKYRDGNAYRVVLIEAGHIGQNIALAATRRNLTACPTAALSHSRIEKLLGVDDPLVAPIYALALGVPGQDPDVRVYSPTDRRIHLNL
jgi:SagB-type dehydrogenase family enzyme